MESIAHPRGARLRLPGRARPPAACQARLSQLEPVQDRGRAGQGAARAAAAYAKLSAQLERFYEEMEHITASLSTVGAQVVSMSAAGEGESGQRELAGQVRDLRDQVDALSDGMREAYAVAARHAVSAVSSRAAVRQTARPPAGARGLSSSARPRSAPRSPPRGCWPRTSARRRSCGRTRSRPCSSRSPSATGSAAGWPTAGRTGMGCRWSSSARRCCSLSFRSSGGRSSQHRSRRSIRSRGGLSSARSWECLVLVAVPVLLLGAVVALRRAAEDGHASRRRAPSPGRLYAISHGRARWSARSSARCCSIPLVGTRRTFLVFALGARAGRRARAVAGAGSSCRCVLAGADRAARAARSRPPRTGARASTRRRPSTSTRASCRTPTATRRLELNEGVATHSLLRPGTVPDRRLLGRLPRAAVRGRAPGAAAPHRDPRQRRRHDGARLRATTSRGRASTPSRSTAS